MLECTQIFSTIDMGLIVLDLNMHVKGWNRWMEMHSGIASQDIIGASLLEKYPHLKESKYTRLIRSVLNFGNYAYFSQKLHRYLIPMKNPHQSVEQMPFMQQSCTASPLRDEKGNITGLFIAVNDVTEYVNYEQKLLEMTKLDPLTGLLNRSYLEKRLSEELQRAQRHGKTFSVIMIDIDYFKGINDTYGHLCGDHTLRQMSRILQQTVRMMDIVGRYGGEEFCCVLPDTCLVEASILAERMRANVETADFLYGNEILKITISLGLAEYSGDQASLETLIGVADTALYQAKREGRNRVICADSLKAA